MSRSADIKAKQEWDLFKKRIQAATPVARETSSQQEKRVKALLNSPLKFFSHYFPHYVKSPFGWFHRKAAREMMRDPNIFLLAEWPREHAKSVFFDVFFPLFFLAREELTGMILSSESKEKASILIGDIQAEIEANQRFIADFGDHKGIGNWQEGAFATDKGVGFWGFGITQNPAGVRKSENRPNYGVVDDADNVRTAKNQKRVQENVDWILGEFYNCLSLSGSRLVVANNRVHPKGLVAHIAGDVEEGDPKREGVTHIQVYATENPKTHKLKFIHEGGVPAWKENYTIEQLQARFDRIGRRNTYRQFYHLFIPLGLLFKDEMIQWGKCPKLSDYDALLSYCDPSWKATGDYKAILLIGRKGIMYYVHWAWAQQTSTSNMVNAHYVVHDLTREHSTPHYMEGGLMQEQHKEHYLRKAQETGDILRLRIDERKKPNKQDRIADLEPLFSSGLIIFNEKLKGEKGMQTLKAQLLGFPHDHDDAPDALEGGIYKLNRITRANSIKPRSGKYKRNSSRRIT